ncbi:MAG TPA: hypothetical protein VG722_13570, partial [Tepidisphaeraceae bacterium]|nr:hypothetical protein [Tepidisphaeraceae bacterium]
GGQDRPLLAVSKDGLHWSRPDLGDRKPEHNDILIHTPKPEWKDTQNVVYDPDDPDPAWRYKGLLGDVNRLPAVSADCASFTPLDVPTIHSSDESQLTYDRPHHQFIATLKIFSKWGRSVGLATSTDFVHWTPVTLIFGTDDEDQHLARRIIADRLASPNLMPLGHVSPEPPPSYMPKTNDLLALWACDVYNMAVFPYGNYYIGMPAIFFRTALDEKKTNTDGFHLIELTASRDLHHWFRLGDRKAFIGPSPIDNGRLGIYDRTQLLPTSHPLVHGNELWFYYTGLKWRDCPYEFHHDGTPRPRSEWTSAEKADFDEGAGAVCLAVLRRDGFVSLDAGSDGSVLTEPIIIKGSHLHLNADANGGRIRVELLSNSGQPIPHFSAADCMPVTDDAVDTSIDWSGHPDLSALKGQTVQIKIEMQHASLYSLWVE